MGIIGRTDSPLAQDGAAALIVDNKVVFAIEQERLSRTRYALGQGAPDAAKACLAQTGLQLSDIDYIAYGWLPDLTEGKKLSDHISVSTEITDVLLPPELFGYAHPPPVHCVKHHHAHAAASYYTSGFDSAAILVIDGRGEGESISLYHAKGSQIEWLESYPIIYSLGAFYTSAGVVAGVGGPTGASGPGKLMGLAPFGQVRQRIDFHFDANTGCFTLPISIQEAIDTFSEPLLGRDIDRFWRDYFQKNFYPYTEQKSPPSVSYDIAHHIDLAASVQHTFETLCQSLVERMKTLTGENNLVLGGGCALNCSMNAHLSRQKTFENLYVFPAANDAGCSIGAALALSYALEPMAALPSRLIAPDFGRSYTDEEIAVAISEEGFIPNKLTPEALAEQVAMDLAHDKIVAWFRGKDEMGPRALGRRSFMANPRHRDTMGRLNKIKGREMWRPLAPSILEEHAHTVLEGSMESGLHRYMLGVATIRPTWRAKISATVHIDFTCRPHFVQQEHDGAYWTVIHKFYEKTGVPLVCNTSLNVAGQPIVHSLKEVLDVFTKQDDVQTLVIEGFYLTKNEKGKIVEQTETALLTSFNTQI